MMKILLLFMICTLSLFAKYAYITNSGNGTIDVISLERDEQVATLNASLSWPYGIAISKNSAYIVDASLKNLVRIDLQQMSSENIATGLNVPVGVAIGGEYAYTSDFADNTITRVNLSSGALEKSYIEGLDVPYGLAISGSYLYISNSGNGTIVRATLGSTPLVEELISELDGPSGIAISGGYLYVTNEKSGSVEKIDIATKQIEGTLVSGLGGPTSIAIYGEYAYVVCNSENRLYKVGLKDSEKSVVSMNLSEPIGIAITDFYMESTSSSSSSSSQQSSKPHAVLDGAISTKYSTQSNERYVTISWEGTWDDDTWFEIYYRGKLIGATTKGSREVTIKMSNLTIVRDVDGFSVCAVNSLGSSCSPAPLLTPWGVGIFLAGVLGVGAWRRRGKQ